MSRRDEGTKRSAKAAENVPRIESEFDGKTSLERFKTLAGGLFGVPKREVERKAARRKAAAKRKRRR